MYLYLKYPFLLTWQFKIYLFPGFKFSEIAFFVANNPSRFSLYHRIYEFSDLEEIQDSLLQFYDNIRKLVLRKDNFLNTIDISTNKYATIHSSTVGAVFTSNILLPDNFRIIQSNRFLFSIISSKIKVRSLMKIELWF